MAQIRLLFRQRLLDSAHTEKVGVNRQSGNTRLVENSHNGDQSSEWPWLRLETWLRNTSSSRRVQGTQTPKNKARK